MKIPPPRQPAPSLSGMDALDDMIDVLLRRQGTPRPASYTSAATYARWEYREDRFELARWLKAPRRGYRVDVEQLTGLITVKVHRRGYAFLESLGGGPVGGLVRRVDLPRHELWRSFQRFELEFGAAEWRRLVAREIRAMRRMMDRARREA